MRDQHDVSKLPAWGQTLVRRLEHDLADAREKLAAGPADSTVFACVTSDLEQPLGNVRVQFRNGKARFQVHLDARTGELEVTAWNGRLAVLPQVTNSVILRAERH